MSKENRIPIWSTLDNFSGERTLAQHAFISAKRGKWYEDEYDGNKSLCGKIGAHDEKIILNMRTVVNKNTRLTKCSTIGVVVKTLLVAMSVKFTGSMTVAINWAKHNGLEIIYEE